MESVNDEPKSLYKILSLYMCEAQKFGNYVKGYIDGENKLESFLKEFCNASNSKFIVRSSCKKSKQFSNVDVQARINCTRYGLRDRIYWKFNNRNLFVPFTGTPFVINSSQVKHCQYGAQYYKLKAEKFATNSQKTQDGLLRHRTPKSSKKKNCPAFLCIREVVLFSDYALDPKLYNESKHVLRKEKANLIAKLKNDMKTGSVSTQNRFFLHIPLPEAHKFHPIDSEHTVYHAMDPFIKTKMDELISSGYELRHIQLIIQDYANEAQRKSGQINSNSILYPSPSEISSYFYLSTITIPTVVEVQTKDADCDSDIASLSSQTTIQKELFNNIKELKSLLNACGDDETLKTTKIQMKRMIMKLKSTAAARDQSEYGKKQRCLYEKEDNNTFSVNSSLNQQPTRVLDDPINYRSNDQNSAYPLEIANFPGPPETRNIIPQSSHHPMTNMHSSELPNMIPSFCRLLECDQDVIPSMEMADATLYHHMSHTVNPLLNTLPVTSSHCLVPPYVAK